MPVDYDAPLGFAARNVVDEEVKFSDYIISNHLNGLIETTAAATT